MRYVASLIVLAMVASVAPAAISMDIDSNTDNSAVLGSGYVTNDLIVTTDGYEWTQSQILLTLTSGSVYQEPGYGEWYPQPSFYGLVPELEFDTWMCDGDGSQPSSQKCAANLTGGDAFNWDTSHLDAVWYTNGEFEGTYLNARITLTDDAQGTWAYCNWDAEDETMDVLYEGSGYLVVDGYMIPEPATMAMLMLGGLGVLARRKRS